MFEGLAGRVEDANLRRADLIVVVSNALRIELVARGVPAERVLVNPNGVDPARYHPGINGEHVRRRLGLWQAGHRLHRDVRPVARGRGAGAGGAAGDQAAARGPFPVCRRREWNDAGAGDPRGGRRRGAGYPGGAGAAGGGPSYLAACDILASPHVPNPDGSRFFGSPTKLFEYMAMGKGIVASKLEQIGEILSHGKTAWLVTPGDPSELAEAILVLAQDAELRGAMGAAARAEAVERHTWEAHVERILRKMVELQLLDSSVLASTRSKEG